MPVLETKAIPARAEIRKTRILTIIVVVSNVVGNIMLSLGMHQVGRIVSASPADYVKAFADPWTVAGVCILVIWMASDLALLSAADLSFVLPVTASSYVLIALAGHFILDDHISLARWIGILVITIGVIVAEETPARTTEASSESLL